MSPVALIKNRRAHTWKGSKGWRERSGLFFFFFENRLLEGTQYCTALVMSANRQKGVPAGVLERDSYLGLATWPVGIWHGECINKRMRRANYPGTNEGELETKAGGWAEWRTDV
jgi:hypothetical protein